MSRFRGAKSGETESPPSARKNLSATGSSLPRRQQAPVPDPDIGHLQAENQPARSPARTIASSIASSRCLQGRSVLAMITAARRLRSPGRARIAAGGRFPDLPSGQVSWHGRVVAANASSNLSRVLLLTLDQPVHLRGRGRGKSLHEKEPPAIAAPRRSSAEPAYIGLRLTAYGPVVTSRLGWSRSTCPAACSDRTMKMVPAAMSE